MLEFFEFIVQYGYGCRVKTWRRIRRKVKHGGGSVMVWGCFQPVHFVEAKIQSRALNVFKKPGELLLKTI